MKFFRYFLLASLLITGSAIATLAQETQVKVVDEVVAQVNDGVITLSRIRREMKDAVDSFVQQGKTKAEAEKLVNEKQGEMIANLINEELLVQKAKESNLDNDIEEAVNRRIKEIMDQNGIKTVDALYKEMEKQGINPQDLKDNWRRQATRDQVLQREVQSKVYWKATGKEVHDYFDKNKAKFTKPETISFSELFLGYAGRNEADVKAKGKKLYDQLKAGTSFELLVKENGDTPQVTQEKGKLEKVPVADLIDTIGKPLAGVKAGDYTAPIEIDQLGVVILRVDSREKASDESVFDENAVRMAILNDQFPAEQKKYMAKLREESLIKINESYRAIVGPILYEDERKTKPGTN